jgi:Bacterial antitoxin of ParD toxin-antitoxin type II system and RHH
VKPYKPMKGGPHMNVSIGERWEAFVDRIVRAGRYSSASEVVREGCAWSRNAKPS